MKVAVYNLDRKKVGDVELDDAVFAAPVREHLFWETVRWQLASRRSGTAATKGRSEVHGTGLKPYRQKGTGRARRGTMKAPHHVGGGTQFGPHPRSYAFPLNRKVRKAALIAALSLRAGEEDGLLVLDAFPCEEPKTRRVVDALKKLKVGRALIVDGVNKNLSLSARNLPLAKYLGEAGLNVYDVLLHPTLVITKDALTSVQERLTR